MHAHAVVVQAMSVQCSKQPNTAHANWDALSAGGWGKVSSILSYTEGHLHCRLPVRLSHCSRHPLLFFLSFQSLVLFCSCQQCDARTGCGEHDVGVTAPYLQSVATIHAGSGFGK